MNETYNDREAAIKTKPAKQNAVYLQSFGAAGTVTGSKHFLLSPDFNIMIDCGLFQGLKALREKNWESLPVNTADIDALILTHAHLDHCGYIPLLVRNGYHNKIYMSQPTRDLVELILRDCAKLQEEDAEKANKFGYSRHQPAKALYTVKDVEAALPYFEVCEIHKTINLAKQLSFSLHPCGHIAGACSVKIDCFRKTIIFSGDIGRNQSELLPAPELLGPADFVVMESTYGDRLHSKNDTSRDLASAINDAVFHKGNVLIPCFAVGRAQEVMHLIYHLKQCNLIPSSIPVYLDSPMAAAAGKTLVHYPGWFTINERECADMFNSITINKDYKNTEKIIQRAGPKIVLAASGMLTGGRVLEYLKHYLSNARNTILLIGFQAEGTRGRALLNHTHELKIHGKYYPVIAKVQEIEGLSAHADQSELITWLKQFRNSVSGVYLVHGEPCAQDALRVKIYDELKVPVKIMKPYHPEQLFTVDQQPTCNS